jgi:hypothetical protein
MRSRERLSSSLQPLHGREPGLDVERDDFDDLFGFAWSGCGRFSVDALLVANGLGGIQSGGTACGQPASKEADGGQHNSDSEDDCRV